MDNSCFSDNNYKYHCNNKEINSNCHNTGCGFCYKFLLGATGPTVATGPQGAQGDVEHLLHEQAQVPFTYQKLVLIKYILMFLFLKPGNYSLL